MLSNHSAAAGRFSRKAIPSFLAHRGSPNTKVKARCSSTSRTPSQRWSSARRPATQTMDQWEPRVRFADGPPFLVNWIWCGERNGRCWCGRGRSLAASLTPAPRYVANRQQCQDSERRQPFTEERPAVVSRSGSNDPPFLVHRYLLQHGSQAPVHGDMNQASFMLDAAVALSVPHRPCT